MEDPGLGLALAVRARERWRVLYIGAMAAVVAAGLILTRLGVSTGDSVTPTPAVGLESLTDEPPASSGGVARTLAALSFGASV